MDLSPDHVQRLAKLARISLSQEEADALRHDLNTLLDYVAQLDTLDTAHVQPTFHAIPLTHPLREDIPAQALSHEAITRNAPALRDGQFVVPKVIG